MQLGHRAMRCKRLVTHTLIQSASVGNWNQGFYIPVLSHALNGTLMGLSHQGNGTLRGRCRSLDRCPVGGGFSIGNYIFPNVSQRESQLYYTPAKLQRMGRLSDSLCGTYRRALGDLIHLSPVAVPWSCIATGVKSSPRSIECFKWTSPWIKFTVFLESLKKWSLRKRQEWPSSEPYFRLER